MFNIQTLLFTIFMVGSGMTPSSDAGAPEVDEAQEDLVDFVDLLCFSFHKLS